MGRLWVLTGIGWLLHATTLIGTRAATLGAELNLVLGDVAAAVGRVQLRRLPEFIAMRRSILSRYAAAGIPIMQPQAGATTSGYRAVVPSPDAAEWVRLPRAVGIDAILPYAGEEMMGRGLEEAPQARRWSDRLVSLPVFPDMSAPEVGRVVEAWRGFSPDWRTPTDSRETSESGLGGAIGQELPDIFR